MGHQPCHHGGDGIAAFIFGIFVGSSLHRRRHKPKPIGANSPLLNLDARQAMIAVSAARVIGFIVMAIFLLYFADTLWHL